MKKFFTVAILAFFLHHAYSQIIQNFEDGTLSGWTQSTAGHWDASSFEPINGIFSLHQIYDNTDYGHDQISMPLNLDVSKGNTIWKFKIRHGYAPSSTNNWAVFIMADTPAAYITQDSVFSGYAIGVDLFTHTDDTLTFYRNDSGTIEEILKLPVNWQNDIGTDPASIVITRTDEGLWSFFISKQNNYDSLTYLGSITDTTYTYGKYFAIYYEYSSSQDMKLWFDDLEIYPPSSQNPVKLYLRKNTDTLQSTSTSYPGVNFATLVLTDTLNDGTATTIKGISLIPGPENTVSDWSGLIAGIYLTYNSINYKGYITGNCITFPVNITIPDNDTTELQLFLWLNQNPDNAGDNSKLDFRIITSNITTDPQYNGLSTGTSSTGALIYSVQATQLSFAKVPLTVIPGKTFKTMAQATDIYGNKDLDANYDVTLSRLNGSGILSSANGFTKQMQNGVCEWDSLSYSDFGYFTLLIQNDLLGNSESKEILGNAYLFFLNDDFEQGNIEEWHSNYAGHWIASNDDPITGNYSLREVFDNSESATEWISHPLYYVTSDTTLEWHFSVRYEHTTPSSSNNWNIILYADSDPVDNADFNGYAIGINWEETNDLLTLWKVTAGEPSSILTTTLNWQEQIDKDQAVDIKVLHSPQGVWTVYVDTVPGLFDNLTEQGQVFDTTYKDANYFAVRYQYTSSYDMRLAVDNIYFGELIPDTLPPHIDTLFAITPTAINVYFNEPVSKQNILPDNFIVDGLPCSSAILSETNPKLVTVFLADSLKEDSVHTIKIRNIADLSNNVMDSVEKTFTWENFRITGYYFSGLNQITVFFNRAPLPGSTTDTSQYTLTPDAGGVILTQLTNNKLTITFRNNLVLKENYTLELNGVEDYFGNSLINKQINFMFYIAKPFDVIINEIMCDVSPAPAALPPYKYIEIYNNSDVDLNLSQWSVQIGTSPMYKFPDITLKSNEYAIICSPEAKESFLDLAQTIPVLNEYYLSASGKEIIIRNNLNYIIDNITYTPGMYQDEDKDNGGWSLERIDPNNHCNQDNNWHASLNPIGGTPGMKNSVYGTNVDTTKPKLENYEIISSNRIKLTFDKAISASSAQNQLNFIINNTATALRIYIDNENPKVVDLIFAVNFRNGTNTLLVKNLEDLCGNTLKDTIVAFQYSKIHPVIIEPINSSQLKLFFSADVDKATAQTTGYYKILETGATPRLTIRDQYELNVVHLIFDGEFSTNTVYHLVIDSIADLNGVTIDTDTLDFAIYEAQAGDIVFNEFMLDVYPLPNSLPPAKYIELKNNSGFDIWLTNWKVTTPLGRVYVLPEISIPENGYLLLTTSGYSDDFPQPCLDIMATDQITEGLYKLQTAENKIIDAVRIETSYITEEGKSSGGWSIERKNPRFLCSSDSLWDVTMNPGGGTPGAENSLITNSTDFPVPEINGVNLANSKQFYVTFSQVMFDSTLLNPDNYKLGNIYAREISTNDMQNYLISFDSSMTDQNHYSLTIENLKNNCGLTLAKYDTSFIYRKIHITDMNIIDTNTLAIKLSEMPSKIPAYTRENYLLNNSLLPSYIIINSNDSTQIYLFYDSTYHNGNNTLKISNISDIHGTQINDTSLNFTFYIPDSGEVIINEILFNPYPGCKRFVEIYNQSQYPVYLKNLNLADLENGVIDEIYSLEDIYQNTIAPGEYLTVTEDTSNIISTYPTHGPGFVQLRSMPRMHDDYGTIALFNSKGKTLDLVNYNEDMHNPLITDPEGVSLERINPASPSLSPSNWTSASASCGYATPSLKNSQYYTPDSSALGTVALESNVFSPDNDGYQDLMHITINSDHPGTLCDITITTKEGIPVKKLVNNQPIAVQNTFFWDGTDDTGKPQKPGFYVINIKLYDANGYYELIRKTIAIARKY